MATPEGNPIKRQWDPNATLQNVSDNQDGYRQGCGFGTISNFFNAVAGSGFSVGWI